MLNNNGDSAVAAVFRDQHTQFLCGLQVPQRVAFDPCSLCAKQQLDGHARRVKVARHDHAIAAIVSGASDDHYLPCKQIQRALAV